MRRISFWHWMSCQIKLPKNDQVETHFTTQGARRRSKVFLWNDVCMEIDDSRLFKGFTSSLSHVQILHYSTFQTFSSFCIFIFPYNPSSFSHKSSSIQELWHPRKPPRPLDSRSLKYNLTTHSCFQRRLTRILSKSWRCSEHKGGSTSSTTSRRFTLTSKWWSSTPTWCPTEIIPMFTPLSPS